MPPEPRMSELCSFVVERLSDAPVSQRARLCRSLAMIAANENQCRCLISQAEQLEAIERSNAQLLLTFTRFPRRSAA